jgi:PAS domain S-box-containing protein
MDPPHSNQLTHIRSLETRIRELEQRNHELAASESMFRTLAEESLVGVYLIQDDRYRYVNAAEAALLGYTTQEMLALPSVMETVAEEDRSRVREQVRRRLAGEIKALHYELTSSCKDGERRRIEVLGTAIQFEGRPAILGTARDITDRKRSEEHFQELQRWYDVTLDREGRVLELKREVNELLLEAGRPVRYPSVEAEAAAEAAGLGRAGRHDAGAIMTMP